MKSNVILAALTGLVIGVIAEFFFAFVDQIPFVGCLLTPVAFIVGLGLPIVIGALAVAFAPSRELTAPVDGALAAVSAEVISRLVGFCASIATARSFFFGPRFLLPSVGPAAQAMFSGVWSLGWLAVSLIIAALLGALGAFLYAIWDRR